MNEIILDEKLSIKEGRRRDLLPMWVKIFCWIFMFFLGMIPIGLVFGLLGLEFSLALYGIETVVPFSLIGMIILFLFAIKGVVAIGLWTEKAWAAQLAELDGILGTIICTFVMFILPVIADRSDVFVSFRLELVALIPYFMKMREIKSEWEAFE